MKKIFCLLIALALCFSLLVSCGKGKTEITTRAGTTYTVNIDIFSLDVGEYKTTLSYHKSEGFEEYEYEVPCTVYVSSRLLSEEFKERLELYSEVADFYSDINCYAVEFSTIEGKDGGDPESEYFLFTDTPNYFAYNYKENIWFSLN